MVRLEFNLSPCFIARDTFTIARGEGNKTLDSAINVLAA